MAQVIHTRFSPWKDASRMITGDDASVMCYIKGIADTGAAGGQVDQMSIVRAANAVTLSYREVAGALAGDVDMNSYTAASGAAGAVTLADANILSVGNLINAINGVAAGQTASRRWRAALGDLPPAFVLGAGFGIAVGATNALLGENDPGLSYIADTSGLTAGVGTDVMSIGIGTNGGTIAGSGWRWPDYFEDIPGTSTTAGVNTPVRSPSMQPRKASEAVTRTKQYRITGFAANAWYTVDMQFEVRDINNNVIWAEPLAAAAATVFNDRSDNPIVGPVGSPLFCALTSAGGAEADGNFMVQAEVRSV